MTDTDANAARLIAIHTAPAMAHIPDHDYRSNTRTGGSSSGSSAGAAGSATGNGNVSAEAMRIKFQRLRFPNYLLPSLGWGRGRGRGRKKGDAGEGAAAPAAVVVVGEGLDEGRLVGEGGEERGEGREEREDGDEDSASVSSYDTTTTSLSNGGEGGVALEPEHSAPSSASLGAGASTTIHSSKKPAGQTTPSITEKKVNKKPVELVGTASYLKCRKCQSDVCFSSDIVSKGFTGLHGRAYLIKHLPPNTYTLGKPISRQLVTGAHIVSDISCSVCQTNLGWKYLNAEEEAQRYKIGKYILETKKMVKVNRWEGAEEGKEDEDEDGDNNVSLYQLDNLKDPSTKKDTSARSPPLRKEQDIWPLELTRSFAEGDVNSEDEDELEDMFLGKWTPKLAAKRRLIWEKEQLAKQAKSQANVTSKSDANGGETAVGGATAAAERMVAR